MKKSLILLSVILVIVSAVSLTACGNVAPQSLLQTPWSEYDEYATYEVYSNYDDSEKRESIGTMNVSYEIVENGTVNLQEILTKNSITTEFITPEMAELNAFFGYVVVTKLALNSGEFKNSVVILDKHLKTKYSLAKSSFVDLNTDKIENLELENKYDKKSMSYIAKGNNSAGDIDMADTIKYKEFEQVAYFDNAYYIALTRSLAPLGHQAQLNFLTPSYRENKMLRRTATASTQLIEIKPHDTLDAGRFQHKEDKEDKSTVTCFRNGIASSESMPGRGADLRYYVSTVPYNTADGIAFNGALLRFDEHNITYMLSNLKVVKNHEDKE